jgi:hypothetical protein
VTEPTQPPSARSKLARLSRGARYTLALLLGLAVAGVGDYISFRNLMEYAHRHHFGIDWGLPVGLDVGIPALLLLDSLRPSRFLRAAAWALSAGTVFANTAVTPDHSWVARGLHGIMPALAILWYEAIRRLNQPDRDEATMDRVRWLRYLVSPIRTVRLRFRMIRWEVTSYADALRLESAILLARAVLIAEYGKRDWRGTRRLVPVILRHQLGTGQLPTDLFFAADWTVEVRTWVRTILDDLDPARRTVPGKPDQTAPDPEAVPRTPERDPWDLIWVLRDRLVPDGVSPEVLAKAYGLARAHFEQFNRHITVGDLREGLGVQKARAGALARLFRTAYESGPVRMLQDQDSTPVPEGVLGEPPETAAETNDPAGPYGRPFVPTAGA